MVGHTGVFEAAVKAVEAVDAGVGKVVEATSRMGGVSLITADHGNAERMLDADGTTPTPPTPLTWCPSILWAPMSNCGTAAWPTSPPPCWI